MKNINPNKKRMLYVLAFAMALITYMGACKKTVYPIVTVDTGVNIATYIDANPNQFSLFNAILARTGYDGFLGAFGGYTVFAPNNDAISLYLKQRGQTSVDQINVDTLKQLVLYHVVKDTLGTAGFKDGKLPTPTLQGQFLLIGITNVNGTSSYSINNNQALIVQSNIKCANGVLHVIDHVLTPASKTLAQLIEGNANYSIFTAALKATGFYDTLNILPAANVTRPYLTAIAVPNSAYAAENITTAAQLIAKYSKTGNPKNPTDSLFLYCAYHILPENAYLADLIGSSSHKTLAPSEIITDQLIGQDILINQITFNNVLEPGAHIDRANSNITGLNGVLNSVSDDYGIKVRVTQPLYWDVADIPEFRANTSAFRKPGGTISLKYPGAESAKASGTGTNDGNIVYHCDLPTDGSHYYWNDYMGLFQFRTGGAFGQVLFHTPTITKGRYKIWFCYQSRSATNAGAQFFFDGGDGVEQVLQNVIPYFSAASPNNSQIPAAYVNDPQAVLEAKGYKRYSSAAITDADYSYHVAYLLGVVNVYTNDRHFLRMKAIGGANNNTGNGLPVDMIHFIPVDQPQTQPRFMKDGTTQIIPY